MQQKNQEMIFEEKFYSPSSHRTKSGTFEWISLLLSRPYGRFGRNTPRQPSSGQNRRPAIASIYRLTLA
jgi:hypothetical protein